MDRIGKGDVDAHNMPQEKLSSPSNILPFPYEKPIANSTCLLLLKHNHLPLIFSPSNNKLPTPLPSPPIPQLYPPASNPIHPSQSIQNKPSCPKNEIDYVLPFPRFPEKRRCISSPLPPPFLCIFFWERLRTPIIHLI